MPDMSAHVQEEVLGRHPPDRSAHRPECAPVQSKSLVSRGSTNKTTVSMDVLTRREKQNNSAHLKDRLSPPGDHMNDT